MPTPSTSVFGAPPHTAAFTGNSAVYRSQRSAPTQKSLMWVIKTQSHDLWHVGRKHCWNFFMDRIGSMFGSLTGLNEWNVCAVTFTLCKTMAVRFIYPSIHLLLFIRCGSRLQQDKQDHLLQMFSPHPASFYVKSLQPYSEAPPDIWSSKSPDTQQMKLVSAIGIRNFPLLVHFSLNSFALGTSSPPTQQSCRPHKNLKHDSQTDLPHIDVLFICKKRITQLGSSFSKITGKKF